MSVLEKLSSSLGVKDNKPNQLLAKQIADNNDSDAIRELINNLSNKNKRIASDCIKVLYEVGYIKPQLISEYANEFINLLQNKNNRMVWGGMIALSTISTLMPDKIANNFELIKKTIENGTVITADKGIKTLANVVYAKNKYASIIMPFLLERLENCRSQSFPQYAESIFLAVTQEFKEKYLEILNKRKNMLSASQKKRVEKLLKQFE